MINRHSIETFISSVSLRMPTIFNKHNFLEGEQYDDHAVLKFRLPHRYSIDKLLDEIAAQDGLRVLYHVIPKASAKKGHTACVYSIPGLEGCYRINIESDDSCECSLIYVTLYDDQTGQTLCADLEDELTDNAAPHKKIIMRGYPAVLLDFMQ